MKPFHGSRKFLWYFTYLYVDGPNILYIDPLGGDVNEAIADTIHSTTGYRLDRLYTAEHHPQHANIIGEGEAMYLDGNHTDCGAFLVHALEQLQINEDAIGMLREKTSTITNADQSSEFGTELRKAHVKKIQTRSRNEGITTTSSSFDDVDDEKSDDNNNLTSSGLDILSAGEQDYNLQKSLYAQNSNHELLNKLIVESVITSDIDLKAIKANPNISNKQPGAVEFISEDSHKNEHISNVESLTEQIKSGTISTNTAIAIERKQYGDNLGVSDMILIVNIIDHNQTHPQDLLELPKKITETSLIHKDAILYKTARDKGVKVVGLEGRNLESNESREEHMAKTINTLTSKGYNVIVNIGSAHEESIKQKLGPKRKALEPIISPKELAISKAKSIRSSLNLRQSISPSNEKASLSHAEQILEQRKKFNSSKKGRY